MAAAAEELKNRASVAQVMKQFLTEGRAIVIAAVSLVITCVALLQSAIAISDAKEANIRSQLQSEQINALREEVAVLEIRVINSERNE